LGRPLGVRKEFEENSAPSEGGKTGRKIQLRKSKRCVEEYLKKRVSLWKNTKNAGRKKITRRSSWIQKEGGGVEDGRPKHCARRRSNQEVSVGG